MKRLLGVILVMSMVICSAPSLAGTSGPAGAADALPMLSSVDLLVIEIEELDGWMASHRTRSELREMNRAMMGVCEELRHVENATRALSGDPQFREDKARAEELGRLRASVVGLAGELSGWQAVLRILAETQGSQSTPASDQDRQKCQGARADISKRMAALDARLGEMCEAMSRNQARNELCTSASSLNAALRQLGPVIRAMDSLNGDPALDRNCLSQINQAQDRLSAMIRQFENCYDCLAVMAPRS